MSAIRLVALLATYNEELFIDACLRHLIEHGASVYLIDNDSTDRTVAIAQQFLGQGLIGIERMPRDGIYRWRQILARKATLATELQADWFMHVDADEIRLPPRSSQRLVDALADVDRQDYNAVNFVEFTFVPTREAPTHEHRDFQRTMRWYYPYRPIPLHRLNLWRQQPLPVDLVSSGGHQIEFQGVRPFPHPFPMRHYLFLSVAHAIQKFVERRYDPSEVAAGWHAWRSRLRPEMIDLPSQAELREYLGDDALDARLPRTQHLLAEPVLRALGNEQ